MYKVYEEQVGPPSMREVGLEVFKGEREDKSDAFWLAQVEANATGIVHKVYPPDDSIPAGLYFKVQPESDASEIYLMDEWGEAQYHSSHETSEVAHDIADDIGLRAFVVPRNRNGMNATDYINRERMDI